MKTNTIPDTISKSPLCKPTDEQRKDFGIKLATTLEEVQRVEEEGKRNSDHYKDRIGGLQATVDELRWKVSTWQEWRDAECTVEFDDPTPGFKSVVRIDNGEVVETEAMTDADKQFVPDLDEPDDGSIDNIVEIDIDATPEPAGEAEAGDAPEAAGY